ncbi:MAG: RluA family pseudouridine synthase [Bdellovibrionales bacterium]
MKTIPLLLETKDFFAVDKPAGVSVHNNEDPQNLLSLMSQVYPSLKFYPAHRLDKETSGIQLLALNPVMAKTLAQEFEKRSVVKIYKGVLRGQVKEQKGVWNESLSDKAEGRKDPRGITRERVACETRYEVLKSNQYFSFCEFQLMTGRQHQIRKHCALHNHAIVGDARYGDKKYNEKMAQFYKTNRMHLHSSRLEILDYKIESPLPVDFIPV